MIVELKLFNGHWLLTRAKDSARIFVVNARDEDQSGMKLLAFLGMGEYPPRSNSVVLRPGTYDLGAGAAARLIENAVPVGA